MLSAPVYGDVQHRRVLLKDVLCAVAMVHVPVQDYYTLGTSTLSSPAAIT